MYLASLPLASFLDAACVLSQGHHICYLVTYMMQVRSKRVTQAVGPAPLIRSV
jgi:hypothetical protein